jgi:hypothetical protein
VLFHVPLTKGEAGGCCNLQKKVWHLNKASFVFTFITRQRLQSQTLAQALHSLVRVSRRADKLHLYRTPLKRTGSTVHVLRGQCKQSHTFLHEPVFPVSQTVTIQLQIFQNRGKQQRTPKTRQTSTHSPDSRKPCKPNSTYPLLLMVSNTFNSLFKVLFTFPSRYLCAIGFLRLFSFGRNLPPIKIALPSNPTLGKRSVRGELQVLNGAVTLPGAIFQWTLTWATLWRHFHKPQLTLDEPKRFSA